MPQPTSPSSMFGNLLTALQAEYVSLWNRCAHLEHENTRLKSRIPLKECPDCLGESHESLGELAVECLGDLQSLEALLPRTTPPYRQVCSECDVAENQTEREQSQMLQRQEVAATPTLMTNWKEICVKGDEQDVQDFMMSGADPNMVFRPTELMNGMTLTFCTPLSIAVLRKQTFLVKWLIDFAADPDGEYGFLAGAEGMNWKAGCTHAAVVKGSLSMLKLLINARADVYKLASNDASLLWQAAYFNQLQIIEYLLKEHKVEVHLEIKAISQDDSRQRHTPLHIAAKVGHEKVVSLLLAAEADCDPVSGIDNVGRSALEDAIHHRHVGVVRLLVSQGAASLYHSKQHNCLKMAFESRNAPMISAIAKGLAEVPTHVLQHLTLSNFIRFLQAGDEVPYLILRAVFRQTEIRFWERSNTTRRNVRMVRKEAFYQCEKGQNVALGPPPGQMEETFREKELIGDDCRQFIDTIAPQVPGSRKDWTVGPVVFYVGHIPEIPGNLDVLLALIASPCERLFEDLACQAILDIAVEELGLMVLIRIGMSFVEVLNLVAINILLNHPLWPGSLACANALGMAIAFVSLFLYFLEALGYWNDNLASHFMQEWFHVVVICANCGVMFYTVQVGNEAKSSAVYCIVLGSVLFVRWMELLQELCYLDFIGMRVLPLMSTMLEIGPFCMIMLFCIVASSNLYYALGRNNIFDSFVIMYRLVFLADFNLYEMENKFDVDMQIEVGGPTKEKQHISMSIPAQTEYYWVVRCVLVFVGFTMSITLMNLFIGVLTVSYEAQTKKAFVLFSRFRASAIVEAHAILHGWRTLTGRRFSKTRRESTSQATFSFDPGEIGIVYDDNGLVWKVRPNGQGESKGLKKGSRIVQVGDQQYSKAGLAAAEQSGEKYQITVEDHNRHERSLKRTRHSGAEASALDHFSQGSFIWISAPRPDDTQL